MTAVGENADLITFVSVHQSDPLAAPLLEELGWEYGTRYGRSVGAQYHDLRTYPAEEFMAPAGVLIIALDGDTPIAGGAFRRYDDSTAELKRIWTSSEHRKLGYGKRVVAELERIAHQRGYRRIYLTTGPRQPEAVALYLSTGYTALYDRSIPPEQIGPHAFEKHLPPG